MPYAAVFLLQLAVRFVRNRLTPFVGCLFTGHLNGQVGKPAILGRAMPVLDFRRDDDHIAGVQFTRRLAPFLIIATACRAEQNLPAALLGMVDMPIVAAAGLKGYVPTGTPLVVSMFR